jgi:hypothetical protein
MAIQSKQANDKIQNSIKYITYFLQFLLLSAITRRNNVLTIIMFLDIIHRLVFCLKCRPRYISKHSVSELDSTSVLR